jgi:hypothetical protein
MMKISTYAYKNGSYGKGADLLRVLAIAACALAVGTAIGVSGARAEIGQIAITCTNPASGATWQINVDYDHHTVDSNPAAITDAVIEWRERNGWKYSLDRKFGKLTVVIASSTGGNFVYDQCKLDK